MVDRSGGTRQTRGEMKIKSQKCFTSLFPSKTVHRQACLAHPSSFPSWQSRSALAPRLASTIRAPQVPYSRVLGPTTPATRRNHQQTRNNAASIDMAIVMRIIGKFENRPSSQRQPALSRLRLPGVGALGASRPGSNKSQHGC